MKSGMYFVAPSLFSQMKSTTKLKDDVSTSHMHMVEEKIDKIHIDSMEKLHVDEDANDLQDVFGICVVKEEGDMHGSDILWMPVMLVIIALLWGSLVMMREFMFWIHILHVMMLLLVTRHITCMLVMLLLAPCLLV